MCCRLVAIVTRLKIDASYRHSCNMAYKHFTQLKPCIMFVRSTHDALNKQNQCEEQISFFVVCTYVRWTQRLPHEEAVKRSCKCSKWSVHKFVCMQRRHLSRQSASYEQCGMTTIVKLSFRMQLCANVAKKKKIIKSRNCEIYDGFTRCE